MKYSDTKVMRDIYLSREVLLLSKCRLCKQSCGQNLAEQIFVCLCVVGGKEPSLPVGAYNISLGLAVKNCEMDVKFTETIVTESSSATFSHFGMEAPFILYFLIYNMYLLPKNQDLCFKWGNCFLCLGKKKPHVDTACYVAVKMAAACACLAN